MKNLIILLSISLTCILSAQMYGKPKWVKDQSKRINGYYVGFGSFSKSGLSSNEYISAANEAAFLDISQQIRVNIYGSTASTLYDDGINRYDSAEFESKSSTVSDLEGLEKEEIYETSDRYFVLWKLSKEKHKKNIEKNAAIAKNFYQQSITTVFNQVDELSNLVKGFESVLKAYGQVITYGEGRDRVVLNTYFVTRIEEIFSRISVKAINYNQNTTFGKGLDAPLIFNAVYNDMVTRPLSGVPVKFIVTKGEMSLREDLLTNGEGSCETTVSKVSSEIPDQIVSAYIDLAQFKQEKGKNVYLDRILLEITNKRSVEYRINVSQMTAERIAVKVLAQEGLPKGEDSFINEKFIAELKKATDYSVIERALMNEVLEANEFNAEECSTDECQVQIGQFLAVRRMIYVLLWKYDNEYNGTIKLVNIESGENEHSESVSFKGSVTNLVRSGVPQWIRSFYSRLNSAKMTFTSNNPSIETLVNGNSWGRLPIFEREVDQGNYSVVFRASGYESLKRNFRVGLGQQIDQEVNLRSKTRMRAFSRSLLFPGLGQFYSSDRDHGGRRLSGALYSTLGVLGLVSTAYAWSEYISINENYNDSKNLYKQSIALDDIELNRQLMISNHQSSLDARSFAVTMTGALGGLWVLSAIDAAIFFPRDYGIFTFEPSIDPYGKKLSASIILK